MSCESFDYGRCGDCRLATGLVNQLGAAYQEVYALATDRELGADYKLGQLDVVSEAIPNAIDSCWRQQLPEGENPRTGHKLPQEHCYNQADLGPHEKFVTELAEAAMRRVVSL